MTPETLLLCPVLGILALLWAWRGVDRVERNIVTWAFVAHVFAAFAIVIYHQDIYRGGDMWLYTVDGTRLAGLLRYDFATWAPEVVKLALHRDNVLPFTVLLEGTSTGTMSALAAFVFFVTGDSVYGACLLISTFAFVGSVSLFRAFAPELTPPERRPVMLGTLLVPSAVFWSSGIVKEAVVLGGLGMLCLGLARLLRMQFVSLPGAVAGAVVVGIVKPYVLFAVVLAFAGGFYAQRRQKLSAVSKAVGLVLAVGGTVMMTRWFPEFSFDRIGETMARTQYNFTTTGGGSNIDLGVVDQDEIKGASLAGQLKYIPLALLNVFVRPVVFDIRNVSQAIAAVEMTIIVVLALGTLRRFGFRRTLGELRAKRWSMFCVVFILVFAPPVGLATGNLGTLSRYRVPMMPMYAATLLALRARLLASEAPKSSAIPTRLPGRRRGPRLARAAASASGAALRRSTGARD